MPHNSSGTLVGRPFVKWFVLCCRTVVLSYLSVTLVYCVHTVGRIKMKLGMWIGLGPGHFVLDGDPARPPPKRLSPQFSANVCLTKWLDGSKCHLVWR